MVRPLFSRIVAGIMDKSPILSLTHCNGKFFAVSMIQRCRLFIFLSIFTRRPEIFWRKFFQLDVDELVLAPTFIARCGSDSSTKANCEGTGPVQSSTVIERPKSVETVMFWTLVIIFQVLFLPHGISSCQQTRRHCCITALSLLLDWW